MGEGKEEKRPVWIWSTEARDVNPGGSWPQILGRGSWNIIIAYRVHRTHVQKWWLLKRN